jgi:hypothetical protein
MSSPIKHTDGVCHWDNQTGDKYLVCGVDKNGKRFSQTHSTWLMASCINLHNGSKYLLRKSRRYLIQRTRS